jgi:DNA-nicking Smr family endonuclease
VIKKKNISKEDVVVWNNYIKNPNDIIDKEKSNNLNSKNKRFKYDLHGFTLVEANDKVKELILSCVNNNFNEVLLITGKGIHSNTDEDAYVSKDLSKLKYSVPEFIKFNSDISKYVISITAANKKDGGDGAIIIKLKKL